ncbi:MAG: hypothetical protein C4576_20860 [Desulfobacteraceae bacterium]|nr:MAG: hypothetical protein C4576_20860 [Desulfobacteraceae bacterium]
MNEIRGGVLSLRSISYAAIALLVFSLSSCSVPVPPPSDIMTPLEQVLVSRAAEESAGRLYAAIPMGSDVAIETFGLSPHHSYMRGVIAGWLGRKGFRISEKKEEAAYLIKVIVQALGADKSERVFGTEGVDSALLPIGIPPLTLFKRTANKSYARFYLDIYERETGRLVHSTPSFEGTSYFNKYTLLFFINISSTDLTDPP